MTAYQPSTLQRVTLWIALLLAFALLAFGIARHGFSFEIQKRFWSDIFERFGAPMQFRIFLQPAMALIAAIPDALRDVREGHSSFFWTAHGDTGIQRGRLREGLYATGRILLLGLSMDLIYQYRFSDGFYPAEAVLFALVLAVIPYFIWRWLIEKIVRWWPRPTARSR